MKSEDSSQTKFLWSTGALQLFLVSVYWLLVRYDSPAAPHLAQAGHHGHGADFDASYPLGVHVMMMLLGGFGFLMTFLRRYGLSALGFTLIITCITAQLAIIVFGFLKMENEFVIRISFIDVIEAGVVSAAVLISFGVIIGKVNLLQILILAIIETVFVTVNCYLGYSVLGVNDVGGSIFIHTFGAYFGLAVSFSLRKIKTEESEEREGPRYTSDLLSLLGTIILWVFWPSFNGLLATGPARHRAVINTYLSLMSATVTTFVVSGILGGRLETIQTWPHLRKFAAEDIQNATLSGGVIVGAAADMFLQPAGAVTAGSLAGLVSTLGYKILGGKLFQRLGVHDTCGVNNLHGMPGILAGLLSVVMVLLASEETYGKELYEIFPRLAPHHGRTVSGQALIQLGALAGTLALAIILGLLVGGLLSLGRLCDGVPHDQLFDDELYWELPDNDSAGFPLQTKEGATIRRRSRARTSSFGAERIEIDRTFSGIAEVGIPDMAAESQTGHLQAPTSFMP